MAFTFFNHLQFQCKKMFPREEMLLCQSYIISAVVKNAHIAFFTVIDTMPSEKQRILLSDWLGELNCMTHVNSVLISNFGITTGRSQWNLVIQENISPKRPHLSN